MSATTVQPAGMVERLGVIDCLRGFALLGILMVNIESFGLAESAMFNPAIDGGFTGLPLAAWVINHVFFEQKMMTLFSLLFGAGIVLFAQRADSRGGRPAGLHYRRMAWLLAIGMLHAYTLWMGDILVSYAVCGMLVYPLWRRSARLLLPLGIAVLLVVIPLYLLIGFGMSWLREGAAAAEQRRAAGAELSSQDLELLAGWSELRDMFEPSPQQLENERDQNLAGYREFWPYLIASSLTFQTKYFVLYTLWRAGGLMLIGMGLLKLGVLSGERSSRFYWLMASGGLGLGLPLVAIGAVAGMAHDFNIVYYFSTFAHFNYVGSLLAALGYIGLIIGCWKAGIARHLLDRLAAVGRMALTNYLMHSLICAALFYGWGLGWCGSLDRFELRGVVVAIWLVQLALSPIWLRRFRFGPVEWLWRSLTYWQRQPMKHPT